MMPPEVLDTHDKIVLTNEQFDAFCEVRKNPPAPSPEIREAAKALDEEGFFPQVIPVVRHRNLV